MVETRLDPCSPHELSLAVCGHGDRDPELEIVGEADKGAATDTLVPQTLHAHMGVFLFETECRSLRLPTMVVETRLHPC